jgi:hypothetical protein
MRISPSLCVFHFQNTGRFWTTFCNRGILYKLSNEFTFDFYRSNITISSYDVKNSSFTDFLRKHLRIHIFHIIQITDVSEVHKFSVNHFHVQQTFNEVKGRKYFHTRHCNIRNLIKVTVTY